MLTKSKKLLNAVKKLYTKVTGGKTTKSNDLPTVIDSMAENYVGGGGGSDTPKVNYLVECHLDNPDGQDTMDVKITDLDSGELILQKTFTHYQNEWAPYIKELVDKCNYVNWFDNLEEYKSGISVNYINLINAFYDTETNKWVVGFEYRDAEDNSQTVDPAGGYDSTDSYNQLTSYRHGFMFRKSNDIVDRNNFTFILLSK